MPDRLRFLWSETALAALADPRSFMRGATYASDGRVVLGLCPADRVTATVRGTVPYDVELWVDDDRPGWSCTCPAAEDGAFCKHCAAVAITVEPGEVKLLYPDDEDDYEEADSPDDDIEDLREYLVALGADALADLVLEEAAADWRFEQRLRAAFAADAGSAIQADGT